jgi:hypothetical protein
MKHIKLYEDFSSELPASITNIPLQKDQRDEFIDELSKHISYPDIYDSDPEVWINVVCYDIPVKDDESLDSRMKSIRDNLERNVWGKPQDQFNKFFAWIADPESMKFKSESDWVDLEGAGVSEYMERFGVDENTATLMKSLYDDVIVIEWENIVKR